MSDENSNHSPLKRARDDDDDVTTGTAAQEEAHATKAARSVNHNSPSSPSVRAQKKFRHLYSPFGITRSPDGSALGLMVHECSDEKRALLVREQIRALEEKEHDPLVRKGAAVFLLTCALASGEWDFGKKNDATFQAFAAIGPTPAGVTEAWNEIEGEEDGPFDSVTLYFLDVRECY